jgi:hypothetical protein
VGEISFGLLTQKMALKEKKKRFGKQINGKFNNIGSADDNK